MYRPPCGASGSGSRQGLQPDSGRRLEAVGLRAYSLVLGSPSAFVPVPPAAPGPPAPSARAGSQSLSPERKRNHGIEEKREERGKVCRNTATTAA